jgi:hypothetical protein
VSQRRRWVRVRSFASFSTHAKAQSGIWSGASSGRTRSFIPRPTNSPTPSRQRSHGQNQAGFGTGPGRFRSGGFGFFRGRYVMSASERPSASRLTSVCPGIPSTDAVAEYCQIAYRRQPAGSCGAYTP